MTDAIESLEKCQKILYKRMSVHDKEGNSLIWDFLHSSLRNVKKGAKGIFRKFHQSDVRNFWI